ncbi:hypothetical protein PAL_GLEAN10017923 [Pteropus alecto]|uniref:Uncharacterized protein n=1 Tax=Pteropus alecto TaxID=9402 RepID=L5KYU8_PTEAL|nr:hypothetical protein PAL_GLEAN10017923 [Pteropus alecto]
MLSAALQPTALPQTHCAQLAPEPQEPGEDRTKQPICCPLSADVRRNYDTGETEKENEKAETPGTTGRVLATQTAPRSSLRAARPQQRQKNHPARRQLGTKPLRRKDPPYRIASKVTRGNKLPYVQMKSRNAEPKKYQQHRSPLRRHKGFPISEAAKARQEVKSHTHNLQSLDLKDAPCREGNSNEGL